MGSARAEVIDFTYPIAFSSYHIVFFMNHTSNPTSYMFTSLHYLVWLTYIASSVTVTLMTILILHILNKGKQKVLLNYMILNAVVWNTVRMMLRAGEVHIDYVTIVTIQELQ